MIGRMLEMLCYGLILLFGIAVSVSFCGVERNRKNCLITGCFFLLTLCLQIISRNLFGLEHTKELYPLIVHLPLVVVLVVFMKCSRLSAVSGVFAAYLCCQIPKWFGYVGEMLLPFLPHAYFIFYMPAMGLSFFFLWKYVSAPVSKIMEQSKRSCLMFGAVPFLYYIFDYASTIYTDWLYSGSKMAVQFIPSVVSLFYFVFVLVYYTEMQKETEVQRERDLMEVQLKQSRMEFDTLRQMQEQTRAYRHDMRHHFSLLKSLALKNDTEKILHYLKTAQVDLDSFTPVSYCENEMVNLLLSYFERIAKQKHIELEVKVGLPQVLSISDTELCSVLSNGLENAIAAAGAVSETEKRKISVQITIYKQKFLLAIENPYEGMVFFKEGIPQTKESGHGYGSRSIATIAENHGGQALFSADEGIFTLKVMIPLKCPVAE